MTIENVLLDAADAVAVESNNRVHQSVADIATEESEQEFGVVMNAILMDYFGFGYNQYRGFGTPL